MADINLKAGNNIELRQVNNDLYIDGADQTPMNVELIAISDTAPTSCVENDKYYNTEDNLVYTATDTDTWSEDGEEPIKDIFYILISNLKLYIYDSETLVEVSGSEPVPSNIELIAVSDTAPSECSIGDKYYNTTDKEIYTATGTNTWSETGTTPISGILYIVYNEQASYSWDGTNLVIVGESSKAELSAVYPIGSIYMSVNNVNPATLFGFGTWEQIKDRFLLSAGDTYSAGATGGSASHKITNDELPTHTHTYAKSATTSNSTTLTVEQIPSHSHGAGNNYQFVRKNLLNTQGVSAYGSATSSGFLMSSSDTTAATGGGKGHTHGITLSNTNTGDGGFANNSFNTMPPYLTVYMWKRIA